MFKGNIKGFNLGCVVDWGTFFFTNLIKTLTRVCFHFQELPAPHTHSYTSPVQPQPELVAGHWSSWELRAVMKHCFLLLLHRFILPIKGSNQATLRSKFNKFENTKKLLIDKTQQVYCGENWLNTFVWIKLQKQCYLVTHDDILLKHESTNSQRSHEYV